jgi:hypothetical protein
VPGEIQQRDAFGFDALVAAAAVVVDAAGEGLLVENVAAVVDEVAVFVANRELVPNCIN